MQKEEERQNRVLKEIIDNVKELPMGSRNLLLVLVRGIVFTRNCVMRQNTTDQPYMPPNKHSA